MKKTVVTLLLVLPFLLIYFVSFTGKILSEYKHIYVERVAVLDDEGKEYESGEYIKLGLNDEYSLKIKVYPELATNKKVTISNNNKSVCEVDPETCVVTTKAYGVSKLIITSKDRHFVQTIINIYVSKDDIEDFTPTKSTIDLMVGGSEQIGVIFDPDIALPENKELIYTVADSSIASVSSVGIVKGLKFGTTTVTITSKHKPEISKTIIINVTLEFGKGLHFANTNVNNVHEVNSAEFDLKSIIIINDLNATKDDVMFMCTPGNNVTSLDYDASRLNEGIIKFNAEDKVLLITAIVWELDANDNYIEYSSTIMIKFKSL